MVPTGRSVQSFFAVGAATPVFGLTRHSMASGSFTAVRPTGRSRQAAPFLCMGYEGEPRRGPVGLERGSRPKHRRREDLRR